MLKEKTWGHPTYPIWELQYAKGKDMGASNMRNTVIRIEDEFQEIGTKTIKSVKIFAFPSGP